jgi:signal transduction histidine kinase/DNA-binding NarL/FixJ family response regulator
MEDHLSHHRLRASAAGFQAASALSHDELSARNLMLANIITALPDLVFILNTEGTITDFHTPDQNSLFVDPEAFLNKNYRDFMPPHLVDTIGAAFDKAMKSGEVASVKYDLPTGNAVSYYEGRFSPFINGGGAVFVVRDVSRQHQTEEKLQSLSVLHQLIVEFSSLLLQSKLDEIEAGINITLKKLGDYAHVDRVYIFDHQPATDTVDNTYEWCADGISPEIENLQGIPFDAVPTWKEKFQKKEHVYIPLVAEIAEEYAAEKEILEPQGIQSLLTLPMFHGEKFMGFIGFDSVRSSREWSEEHIALLRLAGEIIAGSIARDKFETEIIRARNQAEQANKAKSEFLASMSHEIRTPMNAILGFSEILYNNTDDEKSRNFLSGILSSGKTLLYLINDILDLSKIEAGQMEIVLEPSRLSDIFQEMGKIFSNNIAEKNLSFSLRIPEDFPAVINIDDVRLRQILFNLIGNAVKFTHQGFVELSATHKASEQNPDFVDIDITIADSGIGIPLSYQKIIFDAFVQVESDNTRQYGGTGLGLAISNRLALLMNGSLSVESELGIGSRFTISLKEVEVSGDLPERKDMFEWMDQEINFEPATILVVDDVDFNRELAKSYLSSFNFTVFEAKSGREGVTIARMHQPDLILMDLRMPVMNGYEAARQLKKHTETENITCIAFTASSMRHDEAAIREQFDDYLLKPLTRNELIDCLMKFLPHEIKEREKRTGNDAREELPDLDGFIAENPEKAKAIGNRIAEIIIPDIDNLKMYLDQELLSQMIDNMHLICQEYELVLCKNQISRLQNAAESYDFELFNKEILTIENLLNKFVKMA